MRKKRIKQKKSPSSAIVRQKRGDLLGDLFFPCSFLIQDSDYGLIQDIRTYKL